jgi:RNA polymerase sigma factor (sigma-70 family)
MRHIRKMVSAEPGGKLLDQQLLQRFLTQHDETAFAELMQRHGPMVFDVCRSVLHHLQDAQDACQATFLVLAGKAGSIRKQESVSSWLHGVAYRLALRAKTDAAKRRVHERQAADQLPSTSMDDLTWRELRQVVHEELNRLPEKNRLPLVLCYLEGKTQDEAAQELGWKAATLKGRLDRGRNLLRKRFERRGLTLAIPLLATELSLNTATAALPAAMVEETAKAAAFAAASQAVPAGLAANVTGLVEGVTTMFSTKLKIVTALFLAASMTAVGAGLFALSEPPPQPPAAQAEEELKPASKDNEQPKPEEQKPPADGPQRGSDMAQRDQRRVTGVVVDAAGKPVAGADVWLTTHGISGGGAEVFTRTRSDSQGRFQVTIPGRWFQTTSALRQELGLMAYKRGSQVAVLGFNRTAVPPPSGTRLVLRPPPSATVKILAPDGKAVAGAQVSVASLACDQIYTDMTEEEAKYLAPQINAQARAVSLGWAIGKIAVAVPEELSRLLTARTDAQGNATIPDIALDDMTGLTVVSEAFGTQTSGLYLRGIKKPIAEISKTLTLQPVGRLSGRVTAPDAAAVRGLSLTIVSHGDPNRPDEIYVGGLAVVKPDGEGRFEVPALAQGNLAFVVQAPKDSPLRAQVPAYRSLTLKAGATTNVTIPLKPAVRVKGVVRERGTGKPIAGMSLLVGFGDGNSAEEVETDAEGRYTALVPPGSVHRIPGTPAGYLPMTREDRRQIDQAEVRAGMAEYEFPPIELSPATTLRGTVVDDEGRPVPGAWVRAQTMTESHQFGHIQIKDLSAGTNERGEFVLEGIDPKVELRLRAKHKDAVTEKATVLRGEVKQPLTLHVSKNHLLALTGRVVDASGKPIVGAKVEVWLRPWKPPPNLGTPQVVSFDGQPEIRTDEQGKFQTPRVLEREGEYRAVVQAPGVQSGQTAWLAVSETKGSSFPDLVVHRLLTVEGRLRDRRGKPVAEAKVTHVDHRMQRRQTTTDADGRFHLPGTPDGKSLLLVEKAGWRFYGQFLDASTTPLDLVLTRAEEPGGPALKTLPFALTQQERRTLAGRVLEPYVQRVLTNGDDSNKSRALEVLARIDPARVLELIEKKTIKNSWYQDYLRRAVAQQLLLENPDEALTVVNAMSDSGFRATGHLDVYDALPETQRTRKLDVLGQALLHTRNIQDASHRVVHPGPIARRYLDLGETERSTKLLREGAAVAQKLPTMAWAGYARGAFAEDLALIDLPAALELTKDLKDPHEYHRHHGNIAHKLAGKKPAEAERILGMIQKPHGPASSGPGGPPVEYRGAPSDTWAPRVCYRMAPVDLERARKIADQISQDELKAQAYGVMALALAKSQPAQATQLLRQAFTVLQQLVESKKDQFNGLHGAASIAGSLLPVAEQIDPRLVPEFFWRTLSFRLPPPEDDDPYFLKEYSDAALALALARYDRGLAKTLLEPLAKCEREQRNLRRSYAFFPATAIVDPRWALELIESLPGEREQKEEARRSVAKTLALNGEECWREAQKHLGLWAVDTEDY